ncbi:alcohol dehydrogenase [Cladophialophora carrionii]|uniref:Alcohol dehydrogenase n=1 Tax=Cladophialophora carrionii TaxID=86049 RepID=A0A1C1CJD6_9EURO|nr:alcohol dehydrogenase [Cladophialophora carrionii]
MRAITVSSWGAAPAFTSSHPDPSSSEDTITLRVLASGLHQLVRAQAAGTHYSTKTTTMPYIPGADGVGETADGKRVYFNSIAMGGGFAESIAVPKQSVTPIPEGADPVVIAGLTNPGMSSWMAFAGRVDPELPKGFTVVIMGVTAISAKVAVQFARAKGAGKIVGVARNAKEMAAIADLDERIVLATNPGETDFSSLADVDLILDYLYGPAVVALLNQLKSSVPTQFVQIGTVAGNDVALPGAVLRSKNITIRGAGPGAWAMSQFAKELPDLLDAVAKLPDMELTVRKLEEVDAAWGHKKERTVFVP